MTSQDWKEQAKQQIKEWHIKNQLHQDNPKALQQEIAKIINNRLSPSYFDYIHRVYEALTNAVATAPDKIRFLHLGSEWSFSALEITQCYRPLAVTAVDDRGRSYWTARNVLEQNTTLFDGVNIPAPWEFSMKQHREAFDCIFISSPTLTENTWHMRSILAFQALQCVRPGGAAIIQINKALGGMSAQDIRAVMENAGFSHITPLSRATLPLDSWEEATVSCVLGSDKQSILQEIKQKKLVLQTAKRSALNTEPRAVTESLQERKKTIEKHIINQDTILSTYPYKAIFVPDNRCNLDCAFCYWPEGLKISRRLSEKITHEIERGIDGFEEITLSGGEPLLQKSTYRILRYAAEHESPRVSMVSNMNLCRPGIQALLVRGLTNLSCSMDAAISQTYARLRIGGNFTTVCRNLEQLATLRSSLQNHRLRISVNFIVLPYNYKEILSFTQMAYNLGMDSVIFGPLVHHFSPRNYCEQLDYANDAVIHSILQQFVEASSFCKDKALTVSLLSLAYIIKTQRPDIYKLYQQELKAITSSDGSSTKNTQIESTTIEFPCLAPFSNFSPTYSNTACFCCWSLHRYRAIPIDPQQNLQQAFNAPLYQEARAAFYAKDFDKVCQKSCPAYITFRTRQQGAAETI